MSSQNLRIFSKNQERNIACVILGKIRKPILLAQNLPKIPHSGRIGMSTPGVEGNHTMDFKIKDNIQERFNTANAYLDKHENDEDKADQDICLSTILWTGFGMGCAVAVGIVALISWRLHKK